jgi:hypothetical protein
MDSVITEFTKLVISAGLTAKVLDIHEGHLLNFEVYPPGEDLGDTVIYAVAEKDESGWGVNCHAEDSREQSFYHSSGLTENLALEDIPAQLLKQSLEMLASVREGIENEAIIPFEDQTLEFEMQEGSFKMVVSGKEMSVSINPEFLKLTDCTENEMLKATFNSLNEMDDYEMFDAIEDFGIGGLADTISSRVRDSYSSYCVTPVACDCGGSEHCTTCYSVGEYGDIDEGPSLVVVKYNRRIKEVEQNFKSDPDDTETVAFATGTVSEFVVEVEARWEVLENHPTEFKANIWPQENDERELHIQVQINKRDDEEIGGNEEKRFSTHFTVQGSGGIYDESLNERATVAEITECVSARLDRAHALIEREVDSWKSIKAAQINAPKTEISLRDLNRVLTEAGLDREFSEEHDLQLKKLAYDPKTANQKVTLPGVVSAGDIKKHGSDIGLQIKTISSGAKGKGLEL